MKFLLSALFFLLGVTSSFLQAATGGSSTISSSEETLFAANKRTALDLSGALINDGFRNRDGVWNISLTPGKVSLLELTLFEGNQYWFVAAAAPPAKTLKITCYDHEGHPVKLDSWKESNTPQGAKTAAGFLAPKSGSYFVGLSFTGSGLVSAQESQNADASLIYAYK